MVSTNILGKILVGATLCTQGYFSKVTKFVLQNSKILWLGNITKILKFFIGCGKTAYQWQGKFELT